MPEFYLEIVIHAHTALKNYFQPYMPFETVEGWFSVFSLFLFLDLLGLTVQTKADLFRSIRLKCAN